MAFKINNLQAILAVDINFGLAKEGGIPWTNNKDLKFFKEMTTNNIVVMGSKTLLSLPNAAPLKDRINIVVTNNYEKYSEKYQIYDNIFFVNEINLLYLIKHYYKDKTIFIIGGKQIYDLMFPLCSTIWLTQIKKDYNCDLKIDYKLSNYDKTIIYEDETIEIMRLN
jgi:dihydrofolate reductase